MEKEGDERKEEAAFQAEPQTEQDEPEARRLKMTEKDPQGMMRKVSFKADEEMSDEGLPEEKKRTEAEKAETPDPADTDILKTLYQVSNPGIDVAETFSPPRVTTKAAQMGPRVGEAMDLTTGWDFRIESHREKATRYKEEKKPTLLIGSPTGTMFT